MLPIKAAQLESCLGWGCAGPRGSPCKRDSEYTALKQPQAQQTAAIKAGDFRRVHKCGRSAAAAAAPQQGSPLRSTDSAAASESQLPASAPPCTGRRGPGRQRRGERAAGWPSAVAAAGPSGARKGETDPVLGQPCSISPELLSRDGPGDWHSAEFQTSRSRRLHPSSVR